jgi:RarD protein
MQTSKKDHIEYFAALLIFGSNGVVASFISLSSHEIVFWRTLIGSLLLATIFILSKKKIQRIKNKKHFIYLIISGIAMGTSWMFLYEAYFRIGISISTLAYYTGPVIVIALSPLIFHDKNSILNWISLILAVIGMLLVNGQAFQYDEIQIGSFYGVAAAVLYAVMIIFSKKAAAIQGLENSMWQLMMSFLTSLIFVLIKQGSITAIPQSSIFSILILGIVNTGIGCYLYFSSIKKLSTQTVAICGYLEPLSALLFSALLLHEHLRPVQIFGASLILGGLAFGEFMRYKKEGILK